MYTIGAFTFTLVMSGLPAVALAESNGESGADVQVQAQGINVQTGTNKRVGESGDRQKQDVKGQEDQSEVTNSNNRDGNEEEVDENQNDDEEIEIDLEDDEDVAFSLDDLKQKIENRKQELEDEEASTTPKFKEAVKNANEVRLAVHALLASKELIGGIGQQVSEIAKDMNDSVATTTNAEAKMQSRGFFTRLFFGGDSATADVLSQAVAQNQQRIDDLDKLLAETGVSAGVRAVLNAQVRAIQEAQTRLQDLAEKEQKMWGLFSWRF